MLLTDKYAPQNIEDMILSKELKTLFNDMVSNPKEKFTHITLSGIPGIGKTALAKALSRQIKAETLFLNASLENSVDIIRSKVADFTAGVSLNDQIKIVILDEADALSVGKSGSAGAQEVLRGLIEDSQKDVRFILTCNYVNRIIPALLSRCPLIEIKFSAQDVLDRIKFILKSENVKLSKSYQESIKSLIKDKFPKVRDIFNTLNKAISEKSFNTDIINIKSDLTEIDTLADNLIKLIHYSKNKTDIRQYYLDNQNIFERDYIKLAQVLFNKLMDYPIAQISIADYIYKMSIVPDAEIQFWAMCLSLKEEFNS